MKIKRIATDCLADGGESGALMRSNNENACLRLLAAKRLFQGEVTETSSDIINDANRLLTEGKGEAWLIPIPS
jgi:hypothetical protein